MQVVELTNNAGMSGTFGYEATEENNKNSSLCKTVESGLRILNMNGLGLDGLAMPDCLMGTKSTLEELRIGELSAHPVACVFTPMHRSASEDAGSPTFYRGH